MKYKVTCPKCNQHLELDEENLKHRRGICPACENIFYVSELLTQAGYQVPPSLKSSEQKQNPSLNNQQQAGQFKKVLNESKRAILGNKSQEDKSIHTEKSFFKQLFNYKAVINLLDSGKIIKVCAGSLLQSLTIIQGVVFIIFWLSSWIAIKDAKFLSGLVFSLWQFFLLYANYMALRIQFYRFSQIRTLPESDYVITPILCILLTTAGEVSFVFFITLSVPLSILIAIGEFVPRWGRSYFFPFFPTGLLPAVTTLISSILIAFFLLIFTRWMREWLLAFFSIATDINTIKVNLLKKENSNEQEKKI